MRSALTRILALAAIAAAMITLAGCGLDEDESAKIHDAALYLRAIDTPDAIAHADAIDKVASDSDETWAWVASIFGLVGAGSALAVIKRLWKYRAMLVEMIKAIRRAKVPTGDESTYTLDKNTLRTALSEPTKDVVEKVRKS